jgi:hypothetical protein
MNKNLTDKELLKIAPKLAEMEKKNPFFTPSGYFDELPQQIQQRLENAPERKLQLPNFLRLPKVVFAGVSLFLLFLLGYTFFLNDSKEELPTLVNESFFEDYLAWYSEYQPEAYYEMIFSDYDQSDDVLEINEATDDQLTEYLLEYEEYFMVQMSVDDMTEN